MNTKKTFSRGDVAAVSNRMSQQPAYGAASSALRQNGTVSTPLSRAPNSAVAAKVMREVGVSRSKMSEAYGFAKATIVEKK